MEINLTPYQLNKVKTSLNKKTGVTLSLKYNQIGNGNKFELSERQVNRLVKAKKLGKGCRLVLSHTNLKSGGFLPLVFAGLGALAGGISSGVNAYSDYKHKRIEEKEIERHNKEMEDILRKTSEIKLNVGKGLKKKEEIKALTNVDIMLMTKDIDNFRGCFMRDELKDLGNPRKKECGILNYNVSNQNGSHWVAWKKIDDLKIFFDPFGDVKPPKELVNYLGSTNLIYNIDRFQDFDDSPICGYLCLDFLRGRIISY